MVEPGTLPVAHDIELDVVARSARRWRIAVRCGEGEATIVTVDRDAGTIGLDRRSSGVDLREGGYAAPSRPIDWPGARDERHRLRIVVDACSVEVFAGDGRAALTSLVFPKATSTGIRLDADGRAELQRMTVWPLARAMNR